MKRFVFFSALLMLTLCVQAQAHLGATVSEIKAFHPDNMFTVGYTDDGTKYISTEMPLGLFAYYFNEQGISYMCVQIPSSMINLNTQVEIYNKKYVITSKTSWTAYLEGGGMLYISLIYDDTNSNYFFLYANTQ